MNQANATETDGARLQKRFDALKAETGMKKAEFARLFKVPGGASMISQHISGHRPIGLDAAVAYMRGFKCSITDISPTLAAQLPEAVQDQRQGGAVSQTKTPQATDDVDVALQVLAQSISTSPSKGSDALAGTLVSLSKDPGNPIYTDMLRKMLQASARPGVESKDFQPGVLSLFTKAPT